MIFVIRKPIAVVALSLLTACGVATQESGTSATLSGVAVDGYVAGATVYLDVNGNGMMDAFEPRARTDENGYFGVDANGNNYCTSSNANDAQYCLQTGEYTGNLIRITGGIDTLTGLPFHGVLSRSANAETSQITSPLTSLLGVMSSTQISAFLAAENSAAGTSLNQADLNSNPLAISTTTDAAQDHLIRTAWLVHKSVEIIAAELRRRYPSADNSSLPSDFSPYVYQALVSAWDAAGKPDMQTFLGTAANITDLIDNSSYGADTLIQADGGNNTNGLVATDIPTRIADLVSLINNATIFPEGNTGALSQSEVEARGRAIQVLAIMLSEPSNAAATSDLTPAQFANVDAAITDLVNATTLTNLANSAADIKQIATDYFTTGSANTDYSTRTNLSDALTSAGINANTPVTLNGSGGGSAGLTIDSSAGTVNLDVNSVDVDGDGVPDNVTLPGTITPINDYTSVMTLDVMGSQQTVILETDASGNLVIDTSTMNLDNSNLGNFSL